MEQAAVQIAAVRQGLKFTTVEGMKQPHCTRTNFYEDSQKLTESILVRDGFAGLNPILSPNTATPPPPLFPTLWLASLPLNMACTDLRVFEAATLLQSQLYTSPLLLDHDQSQPVAERDSPE
jgi:hypothetical protein